ncbi:MAG TPA: hypothetical protein VJ938_11370 [Acidimicrobiia bacterium]|nr:hypothetical protein [Acidimicrobiia bacterium]
MSSEVRSRGEWPGTVELRRGWSVARCRPWNDQTKNVAALRFDRGSDRFLASCCDWLFTQGVDRVLTPALADGQLRVWRRAGFVDHLDLTIFERSLARPARAGR